MEKEVRKEIKMEVKKKHLFSSLDLFLSIQLLNYLTSTTKVSSVSWHSPASTVYPISRITARCIKPSDIKARDCLKTVGWYGCEMWSARWPYNS